MPVIAYIIVDAPTVGRGYAAGNEAINAHKIINPDNKYLFTNFSTWRNIPMNANELIVRCIMPACWNIYVMWVYSGDVAV
jgi:hypothetical protein